MSGHAVFMTHSGLITMDAVFARSIRRNRGVESVAVVHGEQDRVRAESEQAFTGVVDVVRGFDPSTAESRMAVNLARLAEIERAGGETTIHQDIYQDRWLLGRFDQAYIAAYLVHGLGVLEEVLAGDVRVVVGEMTMALYRTARRLAMGRAPFLYPLHARFFERFYFEDDLELRWRRCREVYAGYMKTGIPEGASRVAEATLAGILDKRAAHKGFAVARRYASPGAEPLHAKLRLGRVAGQVAYWSKGFLERRVNPRVLMSPWEMSPLGMATRWTGEKKNIRYLQAHALSVIPEEQHICSYLLHYQPEYTVEGLGFPVADQAVLIRSIAQSLPVDTLLLVKEQPFMLGRRPARFYQTLLALPNVRLVAGTVSSSELIARSRCVLSISGTCALEALFHGVPTILFSRVFHSEFEGITRVLDIYSLPDRLRDLLRGGQRDTRRSSVAALAAMYAESYPGVLMSEIADQKHIVTEQNSNRLGDALCREMQFREDQKVQATSAAPTHR